MQKTIHICDVCNTETENYNMTVVKIAVHELDEPITVCSLGVCITCLSATGFRTGSGWNKIYSLAMTWSSILK